jgi:hypothetical protein
MMTSACSAYTARVIDGSTGKPTTGVYVIGVWDTAGYHASGCLIDVEQTDAHGSFSLSRVAIRTAFGPSEPDRIVFYKRGYRLSETVLKKGESDRVVPDTESVPAVVQGSPTVVRSNNKGVVTSTFPEAGAAFVVVPDAVPATERTRRLLDIEHQVDCGVDEQESHKAALIPLYRAILEEASELTPGGYGLIELRYWLNRLLIGSTAANAESQKESAEFRAHEGLKR